MSTSIFYTFNFKIEFVILYVSFADRPTLPRTLLFQLSALGGELGSLSCTVLAKICARYFKVWNPLFCSAKKYLQLTDRSSLSFLSPSIFFFFLLFNIFKNATKFVNFVQNFKSALWGMLGWDNLRKAKIPVEVAGSLLVPKHSK